MSDIAVLSRLLQNRLDAALAPGERLARVGQPVLARLTWRSHGGLALSASTLYAITSARVILIGAGAQPDSIRSYLPATCCSTPVSTAVPRSSPAGTAKVSWASARCAMSNA